MKRALVLSGGGCRGAFEVGAVEYLVFEAGLSFQVFLGTSVGALNIGLLGQARNRKELMEDVRSLKELWLNIQGNRSIYDKKAGGILSLLFSDSLYRPRGLWKLIKQYVDLNRLSDPATVVKFATVAQETGELLYADSRDPALRNDLLKYLLASASMPVFFPAVPIQNKHWYDGGLRDITPLGAAFDEKPDEIVVVTTFPVNGDLEPFLAPVKHSGAFKAILRTVDILTSEISANDLQLADAINQEYPQSHGYSHVPIWIVSPKEPLPGGNVLEFRPTTIRDYLRLGYKAAQEPRIIKPLHYKSHKIFKA